MLDGLAPSVQHPVTDEAVRHSGDDGGLADPSCQIERRQQYVVGRLFSAHDFKQLHDVGGREEMQSEHVLGAVRRRRDCVHIEIGCVGRQDRIPLRRPVQPFEDLAFDLHRLVGRLDDEVGLREIGEFERRRQIS